MSEEEMRVLKMIEEGKISADDGSKLLNAISSASSKRESAAKERGGRRGNFGWDNDPFWGERGNEERDRIRAERDRVRAERDRMRAERDRYREEARRAGRGVIPPVPPIAPIPPMPPMPPAPGVTVRMTDTEPLGEGYSGGARFFRVRVSDRDSGESKVDLRLPLGLINFGLKVATRYLPEDMSLEAREIQEAIRSGAIGRLLEVNDNDGDTRVEIVIES